MSVRRLGLHHDDHTHGSCPTQHRLSLPAPRSLLLLSSPLSHVTLPRPTHPPLSLTNTHTHAGGKKVLLAQAGKDASEKFWQFHSKLVLQETAKPYCIGRIGPDHGVDFEDAVIHKIEDDIGTPAKDDNTVEEDEPEDSSYFGGASLPRPRPSVPRKQERSPR